MLATFARNKSVIAPAAAHRRAPLRLSAAPRAAATEAWPVADTADEAAEEAAKEAAEEAAEVAGGTITGGVPQPPALPPMPLQALLKDGDRVTALFRPNSRRWKAATVVGWKTAAADGRRMALRLTFDGFDDVAEVPEAAVRTRVRAVPKSCAPARAVGEGGGAVPRQSLPRKSLPRKSLPPPPPPVAAPEGWTEYYDAEASRVYYCHALSGATQWERPE